MSNFSTPDARANFMNGVADSLETVIVNLYSRWADEAGTENWNDYADMLMAEASKVLPEGSTVAKPRKGSFKLVLTVPGFPYQPRVGMMTKRSYGWGSK